MASHDTLRESAKNLEENNLKENVKNKKKTRTLQQLHLIMIRSLFVIMHVNHACQDSNWVVDSTTSFHITTRKISSFPTPVAVLVGLGWEMK